ncbi:hypothetical protein [Cyanobium gracile]|uniref:Uncharacterized protein n=1 Tax=Cyanobium gracile UHCC 0281 TaxID=3110309 RepID=A0ABU5SUM2_9CYAN|nr:hypothetical protein [Cyanobium gracile]MEA5442052.1 hypothetical protein [Cyanobium gracile UHCC 0281]
MDATEPSFSGNQEVRLKKEAANAFSVIGLVSIGLGLAVLVFSSLPVRLLDPVWQLQLSGALTAAGFSLLIGSLLVCTAGAFPGSAQPIGNNVKLLRNICTWVAILYLVLIPIQLYAGMRVLRQQSSEEGRTQAIWKKFKRQLEATSNEQELRTLLGQLPQPINLPAKLDQPFGSFKQTIVAQADSRFNALAYQTDQARSKRLQGFISEAANNSIKSLLMATGFAALAQGKPGGPTLLGQALRVFGNKSRKRSRSV